MVPKPPTPASGESASSPFAKTELLWRALIAVEVETDIFTQEIRRAEQVFKNTPPSKDFWYAAPPEDNRDPELRALIEDRRSERRHEDRHNWDALDRYHAHQGRWRKAILVAKEAADAATFELDPPNTPVLSRAAIGVKRALQDLGGSVPSPMSIGDGLPTREGLHENMWATRLRVSEWINDLRLVLIPPAPPIERAPLSPTAVPALPLAAGQGGERRRRRRAGKSGATGKRSVRKVKAPVRPLLNRSQLDILMALQESEITHVSVMWTAQKVADKALGPKGFDLAKKRCTELRKFGYLGVKRGRRGGYWILSEGLAALREAAGSATLPRA